MKHETKFILQNVVDSQIIGIFKSIHSINEYIQKNYSPSFNINSLRWTEVIIEI